jgi:hypothetical protein
MIVTSFVPKFCVYWTLVSMFSYMFMSSNLGAPKGGFLDIRKYIFSQNAVFL